STIVGLDGNDLTSNLPEENCRANCYSTPVVQVLHKRTEGPTSIEDIVEQKHMASGNVRRKRFVNDERHRGCRSASIATCLYQGNPQGDSNLANQVSQCDQTSRQHRNNCQRLIIIIILNLATYSRQAILNPGLANQWFDRHDKFFTFVQPTRDDSAKD